MTEPTTLAILGLLFGLGVKHLLVDFALQTPYMYLNKGTFLHPGGILHSLLHVVATILVFGIWSNGVAAYGHRSVTGDTLLVIVILEFIWHYTTDLTKVRICHRYGWRALPAPGSERVSEQFKLELKKCNRFWFATGADQFSHFCNYLVIAWIITEF